MKKRNIMYIIISIVCIISIVIAVYYQMFSNKVVNENVINEIANEIKQDNTNDVDDILKEFNSLFTNSFYKQQYDTENITKITGLEEKNVIYTAYNIKEEKDEKYNLDVKLPVFNIKGDVATEFNNTTQEIFANKTSSILLGSEKYTVYNVEYVAYLNENIISLVIKSTLKEGNSAQRIIVQTYNYDIETGKKVSLNEILENYNIQTKEVNKKIEKVVEQASEQAETISEATGQIVYKRDLNSAIYITDNVSNFFIGKDGQIYIVYAYGNSNVTSEIDIIKI